MFVGKPNKVLFRTIQNFGLGLRIKFKL